MICGKYVMNTIILDKYQFRAHGVHVSQNWAFRLKVCIGLSKSLKIYLLSVKCSLLL